MNTMVGILAIFALMAMTNAINIKEFVRARWMEDFGFEGERVKTPAKLINGQTNILYRYDGKTAANVLQLTAVPVRSEASAKRKHPVCGYSAGFRIGENEEIFCGPSVLRLHIADIGQPQKDGLALVVESDKPKIITLGFLFKSQFAKDVSVKIPIFKTPAKLGSLGELEKLTPTAQLSLAATDELQNISDLRQDLRIKPDLNFQWLQDLLKEGIYLSTEEKGKTYVTYPLVIQADVLKKLVEAIKKLGGSGTLV